MQLGMERGVADVGETNGKIPSFRNGQNCVHPVEKLSILRRNIVSQNHSLPTEFVILVLTVEIMVEYNRKKKKSYEHPKFED